MLTSEASESLHVLVADDDDLFRRLVVQLLRHAGYLVEEASDAPQALARMTDRVFDLLVADVNMPGNEGLAVLREQDSVPVLIVTGDPTLESAVEALRGAAIDYLTKPLSPERFLSRVADGVARGRALRTLRTTEERLRSQLELVVSLRESLSVAGSKRPLASAASDLPPTIADQLSPRECEVLRAFRATPRMAEVADNLSISPHTVKNHIKAIFRKLEVGSQAELLARLGEAERDAR
ncbi:response regulator transcription factor [Nannocystaceae bacterium ST9]